MLVQMSVAGMILDDDGKSFFVLLKEMEGSKIISVQVDRLQAESIAVAKESAFSRIPDPYDFLNSIMDSFEIKISKVIIKNQRLFSKNTEVFLTDGDREIRIDSYAGDAVVSALYVDAPIYINDDFLGKTHKKELRKWLSKVKPSDFR